MKARRVKSRKTGRRGWQYRYTDPLTKRRAKKTFWYPTEAEADRAFQRHLAKVEDRRIGLPDNSGWEMPYPELVERFLEEAPIRSQNRWKYLKCVLERNELGLRVGADLAQAGKLTAEAKRLLARKDEDGKQKCTLQYVRGHVQGSLKQLSRWAASVSLLPFDPLAAWSRLPWDGPSKRRRAFTPDEIRAVLAAVDELDATFARPIPSSPVFVALLVTGNRPGAMLQAKVKDLGEDRIRLHAGHGNKRTGAATIPPRFRQELQLYLQARGNPTDSAPLFVSYRGSAAEIVNLSKDFKVAMTLAAVKAAWPDDAPEGVEPLTVAFHLFYGRPRGLDGRRPTDPAKIAERERRLAAAKTLAEAVRPAVDEWLHGRDMYALRKTHITWARRLVSVDAVRVQVGHAPRDVEEQYYVDASMADPNLSSAAVWDVLTKARDLSGKSAASDQAAEAKRVVCGVPVEAEAVPLPAIRKGRASVAPILAPEAVEVKIPPENAGSASSEPIENKVVILVEAKGVEPSTSALRTSNNTQVTECNTHSMLSTEPHKACNDIDFQRGNRSLSPCSDRNTLNEMQPVFQKCGPRCGPRSRRDAMERLKALGRLRREIARCRALRAKSKAALLDLLDAESKEER
jgi:integrase